MFDKNSMWLTNIPRHLVYNVKITFRRTVQSVELPIYHQSTLVFNKKHHVDSSIKGAEKTIKNQLKLSKFQPLFHTHKFCPIKLT